MHVLVRLLQLLAASSAVLAAPVVKLPGGSTISGLSTTNDAGTAVNAFVGIPYAEPPVGELRWRQTKLKTVTGDLNATEYGNTCYATSTGNDRASEDCLYLNIFAPANATSKSKLPVFVWIHGGGFQDGAANQYDGSNLIGQGSEQRIVISVAYRLGLFGFFSNADILKQGEGANFGLRDQENGFEWIKKYIKSFGGNPKDITAFGESAGSMSVAAHLISRDGKQKLFQKAIMQSGAYLSAHDASSVSAQARDTASVAQRLNCTSSQGAVMDCLRKADAATLFEVAGRDFWTPSVDGVFMYETPIKRVQAGKVSTIPAIIGTNTDEGWLFTMGMEDADKFESYLLQSFPLLTTEEVTRAAELYSKASFASGQHRIAQAFGDATFVCPTDLFAQTLAKRPAAKSPVYRYRFDFVSPSGSFLPTPPGIVLHASEIAFVFQSGGFKTSRENSTLAVSDYLRKYWTTFVDTASPNGNGKNMPTGLPTWPLYDATKKTLHMQEQLSIETSGDYMPLHNERCAFWYDVDLRLAALVNQ